MKAKIYQPSKSVTQSGSGKSANWILEFSRSSTTTIDPVMNWTSSSDTQHQVKLKFSSKELAIAFAEKIQLNIQLEKQRNQKSSQSHILIIFHMIKKLPGLINIL